MGVTTTASCEAFCEHGRHPRRTCRTVTTTASCEAFCEACLFLSIYFRQCKGLFSGRGARWEPKWPIFDPLPESGKRERIFSCFSSWLLLLIFQPFRPLSGNALKTKKAFRGAEPACRGVCKTLEVPFPSVSCDTGESPCLCQRSPRAWCRDRQRARGHRAYVRASRVGMLRARGLSVPFGPMSPGHEAADEAPHHVPKDPVEHGHHLLFCAKAISRQRHDHNQNEAVEGDSSGQMLAAGGKQGPAMEPVRQDRGAASQQGSGSAPFFSRPPAGPGLAAGKGP